MKLLFILPAIAAAVFLAAPAHASDHADTERQDRRVSTSYVTLYAGTTKSDEEGFILNRPADGESSFQVTGYSGQEFGIRFGRWQRGNHWMGIATDFSYHATKSDSGNVELTVMTLAPMLMFRVPIGRDEENPDGLVSLFAGFGPTFNRVSIDADIPTLSQTVSDIELTIGLQWVAGVRWEVAKGIALVGEYRFSQDDFSISEFEGSACIVCPDVLEGEARLDTHHMLVGISFPL